MSTLLADGWLVAMNEGRAVFEDAGVPIGGNHSKTRPLRSATF